MLPECKNVTKQNCVTLWETDDDGKQVTRSQNHRDVDFVIVLSVSIITIAEIAKSSMQLRATQ